MSPKEDTKIYTDFLCMGGVGNWLLDMCDTERCSAPVGKWPQAMKSSKVSSKALERWPGALS